MFKPDIPISNSTNDLLGRSAFAISLATAILSYGQKESVVTGLYGKWGSGKSSVINMCIEHIKEKSKEWHKDEKPIIINFNPWNFSDQNQLISQFFIQLSVALNRTDKSEAAIKISKMLETYSTFFLPISLIPDLVVSQAATLTSKTLKRLGEAFKNVGELKRKDLEATRDDLDELLRNLNQKILIFIDDIDRLNGTEIRQIFQLVKLLGDFPNTIYILSLDDGVVIQALEEVQAGVGDQYLEKIIQIPFQLPITDTEAVHNFLKGSIDTIIEDVPEEYWDPSYWGNIFHSGFKNLFTNLRDVIRFINILQFSFTPIKHDVNAIDFIALTALQVFEPEVYRSIALNKDLFSGLLEDFDGRDGQAQLKDRCDLIFAKAKRLGKEELSLHLRRIFPKLQKIYDNQGYSPRALDIWRRQGRACSPDKFEIYFRLCIPIGEFSELELKAILSAALDRSSFKSEIERLREERRINRFLNRMHDYVRHEITADQVLNIFHVLLDLGDTFPDEGDFRGFGISLHITQILTYLINKIESQESRYQIIHDAFSHAENSLYVVLTYLYSLGWNHGKWTEDGKELEPEDRRIVSTRRLTELEQLVLGKIHLWAHSDKLKSHVDFLPILYRWKDLSGSFDEPKAYVASITKDLNGIIHIICSFSGKSYSYGIDDYVAVENIRVEIEPFQSFSDPKYLVEAARPLVARNSVELAPAKLNILKVFIDVCDKNLDQHKTP